MESSCNYLQMLNCVVEVIAVEIVDNHQVTYLFVHFVAEVIVVTFAEAKYVAVVIVGWIAENYQMKYV